MRLSLKVKGEPSQQKTKIAREDFKKIVTYYAESNSVKDKLFSFAMILLFNTGERNASIRTLPFDYFTRERDGTYMVRVDSFKTDSSQKYQISAEDYQFIANLKKARQQVHLKKELLFKKQQK